MRYAFQACGCGRPAGALPGAPPECRGRASQPLLLLPSPVSLLFGDLHALAT